ncbi:hypothetical protein AMJ51_01875 [Microgenomates bacterium DG_75]|nr:MAG: hypothetical protein AMJ51_01875 [Microgenomates bacterium DG_75]
MRQFLLSLIFWLVLWVGGWIFLRKIPRGLSFLDRQLFLKVDYQFVFIISAIILGAIILSLFFFILFFGRPTFFSFELNKINLFLMTTTGLIILINFLSALFIKEKNFNSLILGFSVVMIYYCVNTLFQQIINFGLLLEGVKKITHSSGIIILLASILFSLSHLVSFIEGFSVKEVTLAVFFSFVFGLMFSFLRLKYVSVVPGFLFHFSLYLLWNGPLLFLVFR